jgi:hypothetical protein
MDLTKLTDDRILNEWTAVAGESGERIEIPVDVGDWSLLNEIRAEICLPPDADGQILFTLGLDTRTDGFDTNDGYWSNAIVSPRGGNIWEGWREIRMPAECFYARGIPSGWDGMQSASISAPAGSRIRNVRLVEREIVAGPRMPDETLLQVLNLDHHGLKGAKQSGSTEDALHAVATHFRQSTFDRHLVDIRPGRLGSTGDADRILEGWALGQDWTGGIDWEANPTGYIEWTLAIHYLSFLRPVIEAWQQTREPKYALGLERYIADWMKRNPVPYGVRGSGYPWGHSLVGAIRPFSSMVDIFCVLCECPETGDRTITDMLKSFWEHEDYLLTFESFPPSNKTIAEGRTIAALGCAFPEFRQAASWREEGYRRLLEDMRIQVMPDGASYELTPGYQMAIASWFLESFQVARKFQYDVDPELEAGIRRMYEWCVSISRPDFSRPSISDAGSTDALYREALAGPGRILDNEAALWVGTEGEEGNPPEYTSIARQDSGYFMMRSGWDRDARCLVFEGGPYGRFHQHEDMLGLDIYAYGTPFIVDPGITSYYPNAWSSFYRTTQAHNTVLVDGCGQNRRTQTIPDWVESARNSTVWRSDEKADVAVATYDAGYAGLDTRVDHRRAAMFVKPDYFLVFDELAGEGRHVYEALFHFMPFRVLVDPDTKAVRTGRMNAPNIEILPLVKMTPKLICGQNDPVQGWLALSGQDVPAPVAVYKKTAELPFRTGYVIYPFGADRVTADVTTRVTRKGDTWSVRITRPDGSVDRIKMDWASGQGPELL